MAIEVLIRRRFIKEKEAALAPLIVRLRSLALAQPGYISGETLRCIDPEDEALFQSMQRRNKLSRQDRTDRRLPS
ncbi:MAG: hypothetical protein V2I56_24170 [Desulfobacteraceae bacterium]|jgi:hypothetical protein|nr:hypothetical protein [Desulfobacteraceae bacterium]